MLTLLIQGSDERALRSFLDEAACRQLAENAGVHMFLIDGGSVTELKADNHEHDRRAS